MRCIKIEFNGYKRLAKTSCNTDGKMIAFVGPNESGKSSVLHGLDWHSNADGPLAATHRNRSQRLEPNEAVVRARFSLDGDDRDIFGDLPVVGKPLTFSMGRYPDGGLRTGLMPPLRRDPAPFDAAREALATIAAQLTDELAADEEAAARRDVVEASLADSEKSWDEDADEDFDSFCDWLREPQGEDVSDDDRASAPRAAGTAELLEAARDVLRAEHPERTARNRLIEGAPQFVLFSEKDRELHSEYDIADQAVRSSPPGALANLLWIAELDLEHLWRDIEDDNTGAARTRERRANENLRMRLGPKWSQESIEVQLNVSGTVLEVLVVETSDEGADTPITERSDGLRMFVALVAFLARHGFETPPILLVDEAETHLHYDAQADLVEVLTNDVEASQVFYTTHSPGCLPRDLGTGVRLVAPVQDRRDASELRNDFWTNERPGFTPLLFAMGAGAAAFSAFRRAVLTEGAADMILLPSLFRIATGLADLQYQVAPGLANHHGSGLELEETAARVVYLLDGDEGGAEHRKRLTALGIDEHRVFQFDENTAPEDYVHPNRYLEAVNALINSTGKDVEITLADLDRNVPISKAVSEWCKENDIRPPGKPVVASVLVGEPGRLALADGAKEPLAALHRRMIKTLDAPPGPRRSSE